MGTFTRWRMLIEYLVGMCLGIKLMKMFHKGRDHIKYFKRGKCGVEVLGMKPERTKDGKYSWKGLIMTELKTSCKKNGIKKFSKMDKCELVIALMKC